VSHGEAQRRALRVLLVANDGFSAGHVARTLAIARGIARQGTQRGIEPRQLLVTTSEAHALLAGEPIAIVRLPAPLAASCAGFSDQERRRLVRGALEGVVECFGPDLIVCDTFPSGPHGELAGIAGVSAKRALVRRSVPDERARDEALTAHLGDYDLAIVADDPFAFEASLPIPVVRVPPITLSEACDGASREAARTTLGLPARGPCVLVAAGGGGDPEAAARAAKIAEALARIAPDTTVVLAIGPLAAAPASVAAAAVRVVRVAPLQPLLSAFDAAFAPAGYNTAHELAKARVPAALFALPRPFDDQASRAARFAQAKLACELVRFDDDAIATALAWATTAPRPVIEACGADRAADALLDLATRPR
jgi:predicted glycosyltransferase